MLSAASSDNNRRSASGPDLMPWPQKYDVGKLTIRPWFIAYLRSILILVLYCLNTLLNSVSIYGPVNLGLHLDNPLHHYAVVTHSASSSSFCPFLSPFLSFLSFLFPSFLLNFFVFLYFFFRSLFLSVTYIPLLFFSSFCLPTSSI